MNAGRSGITSAGVFMVLHEVSTYLADSIASALQAVPVFAFVSRQPWHGKLGDWERAAEIARTAGTGASLGEWADQTEHGSAALACTMENGPTHALTAARTWRTLERRRLRVARDCRPSGH